MKRFLPRLRQLFALLLGVGFLFVGFSKTTHPYDFLAAIHQYQLLPPSLAACAAAILPFLEIAVGLALASAARPLLSPAAGLALLLGVTFLFAQSWALWNGLTIDCGCFGSHNQLSAIGPASLARAAAVVVASVTILWLPATPTHSAAEQPTASA